MASLNFRLAIFVLLVLLSPHTYAQANSFAGYNTTSDVTEHSRLDLDQEEMERYTDQADFDKAKEIYTEGSNSQKSGGEMRTLQGFSTTAADKMGNEGYYKLYRDYWDDDKYADTFVSNALDGSGDFNGKGDSFRGECANKGSQYQNVWMYVIHEMEDAINDCKNEDLEDNDGQVEAWDEAVAFYTGSKVGSELTNSEDGFMLYTLAQKRCADYGTCDGDGVAKVNVEIMELFKDGKSELVAGNCGGALQKKNEIVKLMFVPLVQSIHRYIHLTAEGSELEKSWGEGWAFSAAVLPRVHQCDEAAAEKLRNNFSPTLDAPMGDGEDDVSKTLQGVYNCLGIDCDDVGSGDGLSSCEAGGSSGQVPGTEQPALENASGLSGGAVAGIVILLVVVVAVLVGVLLLRKRKQPKMGTMPTTQDGQDENMFA